MSRIPRPKKGTKADSKAFNNSGRFARFPFKVYQHENYRRLTTAGKALLMDIFMQFYGKNNGDLCAAWSVMKECGWKSQETLQTAKDELLHYGLIECKKHGGLLNGSSLYAVTWLKVDRCNDKVKPTTSPSGLWRKEAHTWKRKPRRRKKTAIRYP